MIVIGSVCSKEVEVKKGGKLQMQSLKKRGESEAKVKMFNFNLV